AEAAEATELIEDAVAPEEIICGCRQLVAVRTELEPRRGTMVVEVALDDSILQHAAEGNAEAARRPGELPRQGEIRREQHRRSRGNGAAGGEKRAQGAKARDKQNWNGNNPDREEHHERRAVRGRGEGDEHKKPNPLQACENRTMKDQEVKRKDAQPGEDVG